MTGLSQPVSALRVKMINSLKDVSDASGDESFTGVGFTPKVVIAFSALSAATEHAMLGIADSDLANYLLYLNGSAWESTVTKFLNLWVSSGNYQEAIIKSMDSDGFTVTWTKTGTPTGASRLNFLCLS